MLLCLAALPAPSQTPPKATTQAEAPPANDEAVHNELRALRDGLVDAMNKGDIERELTYLAPNVVVTWHNAEVSRGREGVRAYLARILSGPNKFISGYSAKVDVDELTILYGGDTGISFGSALEHFTLTNGTTLDLASRWSATLVKMGDKWLVASLHASDNLFDNAMLTMAKRTAYWTGGICLVVGLLIGMLVGRARKKA
jgi:ketosteroid isomerase-like protein